MILSFYLVSVLLFLILGFYNFDYWFIATVLSSIYFVFVLCLYFMSREKVGTVLHEGEGQELKKISSFAESVIEEQMVSSTFLKFRQFRSFNFPTHG